jgi:ATP dependent DNA ligase domain
VVTDYTPMAPTRVRDPFHRDGWVYEEKVDGWRIVAYKDGDRVRLVSRNGVDHTRRLADLAAAVAKLSARTLVLDGEGARAHEAWSTNAADSSSRRSASPGFPAPRTTARCTRCASGIGRVAVGMAHQGYDLQLTR